LVQRILVYFIWGFRIRGSGRGWRGGRSRSEGSNRHGVDVRKLPISVSSMPAKYPMRLPEWTLERKLQSLSQSPSLRRHHQGSPIEIRAHYKVDIPM
jgi:hypothetical protein